MTMKYLGPFVVLCLFSFSTKLTIHAQTVTAQSSVCRCCEASKPPEPPSRKTTVTAHRKRTQQPPETKSQPVRPPCGCPDEEERCRKTDCASDCRKGTVAAPNEEDGGLSTPPDAKDDKYPQIVDVLTDTVVPGRRVFLRVGPGFDENRYRLRVGACVLNGEKLDSDKTDGNDADRMASFIMPDPAACAEKDDAGKGRNASKQPTLSIVGVDGRSPASPQRVQLKIAASSRKDGADDPYLHAKVILYSAFSVCAVLGCVWLLANSYRGTKKGDTFARQSFLCRLIVDAESRSYSLQRIQFYLWTLAAVFAYCYQMYASVIAQNSAKLLPKIALPPHVLGIVSTSVATTVLATGAKAIKGPEGEGAESPVWRDLITTGDVIAPEKVQYVVWTIIGLLSFLYAVVVSVPSTMTEIQDVSESLLTLGGVSSAAYLLGKLFRKAGPVIQQIAWSQDGNDLVFDIKGINLSQDGTFKICGLEVPIDSVLNPSSIPGQPDDHLPLITVKDTERGMAKGLRLHLRGKKVGDPAQRIAEKLKLPSDSEGAHCVFVIVNPDGQRAERTLGSPSPKTQ